MKNTTAVLVLLCAASLLPFPSPAAVGPAPKPAVEVAFVLDTTGSMGGLIQGAKETIWGIANRLVAADPSPDLRLGLVAYRDRGDQYVTRIADLTGDIDRIHAILQEFRAEGGGDGPESVNLALQRAVADLSWSRDPSVLRIIFLVGDYPPHMDYAGEVRYPETCREAAQRGIVINTIQCGENDETARHWREIARLAEGRYVGMGQGGDVATVATPWDGRLSQLNAELSATVVTYGSAEKREEAVGKLKAAAAAPATTRADRLAFTAARETLVTGGGDLLDDLRTGAASLRSLPAKELPAELAATPPEERERWLAARAGRRDEIRREIADLVAKRRVFLEDEARARAASGRESGFDRWVGDTVREQGARKGIAYR